MGNGLGEKSNSGNDQEDIALIQEKDAGPWACLILEKEKVDRF